MFQFLSRFAREENGIMPVEYALIAAIIAVFMTVAASAAGFSLAGLID